MYRMKPAKGLTAIDRVMAEAKTTTFVHGVQEVRNVD
jgi:hypothetical protein